VRKKANIFAFFPNVVPSCVPLVASVTLRDAERDQRSEVRLSERNTKGKLVFLFISERKYLRVLLSHVSRMMLEDSLAKGLTGDVGVDLGGGY